MSVPVDHTDETTDPTDFSLAKRVAAEAAGTFILVFVGLGALLYSGSLREIDPLVTALAFGVAFATGVGLFARISGGHINPAISLGAAIKGHLGWADLPAYWLGQLVGALAAGALLFVTIPGGMAAQLQTTEQALFGQTANTFGDLSYLAQVTGGQITFSIGQVLVLEAVAAAVLTAVVLATAGRARTTVTPVLAGLTLTGLILLLEPVSGGSVNPARSTASAIFSDTAVLGQLWLFWVAPLIGGALAGLAYLLFSPTPAGAALADDEARAGQDEQDLWAEQDEQDEHDPWADQIVPADPEIVDEPGAVDDASVDDAAAVDDVETTLAAEEEGAVHEVLSAEAPTAFDDDAAVVAGDIPGDEPVEDPGDEPVEDPDEEPGDDRRG